MSARALVIARTEQVSHSLIQEPKLDERVFQHNSLRPETIPPPIRIDKIYRGLKFLIHASPALPLDGRNMSWGWFLACCRLILNRP
jgi:hypothetical protein